MQLLGMCLLLEVGQGRPEAVKGQALVVQP